MRYRVAFALCSAALLLTSSAAQASSVLQANGFHADAGANQYQGIWDGAGVGAGGSNVSRMVAPATSYGFGAGTSVGTAVADDFVVPAGQTWSVNEVRLYAYVSNSQVFPFTTANLALTGRDVNGSVLDSVESAPAAIGPGGIVARRVNSNSLGNDSRRIYEISVSLATPWTIAEGHHWLRWSLSGSGMPFVAPIVPGNGLGNGSQSTGGNFGSVTLTGTTSKVEFPFMLVGNAAGVGTVSAVPEPSTLLLGGICLGFAGLRAFVRRRVAG